MSTAEARDIESPLVVSHNKAMEMSDIKDDGGVKRFVKEDKLKAMGVGRYYWKINVASIVAYVNGEMVRA